MPNYLKNSLKRHVNRRMNRMIQRQVNQGVDSVLNQLLPTSRSRYRPNNYRQNYGYSHPQHLGQGYHQQGVEQELANAFAGANRQSSPIMPQYGDNVSEQDRQFTHFVQLGEESGCDELIDASQPSNQPARSSFDAFNPTHSFNAVNSTISPNSIYQSHGAFMNTTTTNSTIPTPTNSTHQLSHAQPAQACYQIIDNKANSNAVLQGVSGFFGFIATTAVDVGAIPLIYATLWNEIRAVYGQPEVQTDDALKVIANILPEVLSDAIFDKVLGNVPIIGVYFNAICAKQMTWRLGTLFTLLASRGDDISSVKCKEAMMLIRHMFPQKDMFSFTTPDHDKFIQVVESVKDTSADRFNDKVDSALAIFMGV